MRYGKKTLIIRTSMVKDLRMKELNRCLTNSFAKLRSCPRAEFKQLSYYIVPSLVDETPNKILIYRECNNSCNKTPTLLEIAKKCREYEVNLLFENIEVVHLQIFTIYIF